jgi:hypothetical protein
VAGYRAAGRAGEASHLVLGAVAAAECVSDVDGQAGAWVQVAVAWGIAGRADRAGAALDRALSLAGAAGGGAAGGGAADGGAAGGGGAAPAVVAEIVRALVAIGQRDRAAALAAGNADPVVRASAPAAIAAAQARSGDVDRALATARTVTDPDLCEHALAEVAVALARGGSPAGALALLAPTDEPVSDPGAAPA